MVNLWTIVEVNGSGIPLRPVRSGEDYMEPALLVFAKEKDAETAAAYMTHERGVDSIACPLMDVFLRGIQ